MKKTRKPKCRIKFVPNPPNYDHDYLSLEEAKVGLGYIARKEPKKVGLIQCPHCGQENYSMAVASGVCSWCGFDLNKEVLAYEANGETTVPTRGRNKKSGSKKIQAAKTYKDLQAA